MPSALRGAFFLLRLFDKALAAAARETLIGELTTFLDGEGFIQLAWGPPVVLATALARYAQRRAEDSA